MIKTKLLAHPQQCGKSYLILDYIEENAKQGRKILVACQTAKLTMEYKRDLGERGVNSFVLMSYEKLFDKKTKLVNFACPKEDDIRRERYLGVAASTIREEHCNKCPFKAKCYYPQQYKEVMETKHNVVIMQHAHFSCQEVMYELSKKNFDVLIIDEEFLQSLYKRFAVRPEETQRLEERFSDKPWVAKILAWLKGNAPKGELNPSVDDLDDIHDDFVHRGVAWRIPELVRFYNQGHHIEKLIGIEVVYELPKDIPLIILANATPPVDLLKQAADLQDIEVWGDDFVIDIKDIHPENEIIQVLDFSCSKTGLRREFNHIMGQIAPKLDREFRHKKVLLTLYKDNVDKVIDYFRFFGDNLYPSIMGRIIKYKDWKATGKPFPDDCICIDSMNRGTNEYEDFDVQILMAGVFMVGRTYDQEAYKYKTMANYYNKKYDRKPLPNLFPYDEESQGLGHNIKIPIRRVEVVGKKAWLTEYPDVYEYPPALYWHKLIYDINISSIQQSIRIRFKPDKPRKVFILTNQYMPSMPITKSVMLSEL